MLPFTINKLVNFYNSRTYPTGNFFICRLAGDLLLFKSLILKENLDKLYNERLIFMTELVFILDRSFSMKKLVSDTIGGFNSMIKRQKEETDGNALISTVLFNHKSLVLHDRIPLTEIKPLTEKDYEVGGSTALLDSLGNSLKHIRNIHKYARDEDRPQKTLFVITTDGRENCSHIFSYYDVKRLIEQQKELGWQFIFLGANIDAVEVAGHIGIDARRAVNYHADSRGTREVYEAIGNFACAFSAAPISSMHFDDLFDDNQWRNSVDKDFFDRLKK